MATSAGDQVDQLKSLIDDLEERRQNLRLFDGSEEINSHCDDLIGQVTLTVESAMDHLNKVQDRMINEVNDYRRQLLDAQGTPRNDQTQSPVEKDLSDLSSEIEAIKENKLPHDEALQLAKSLLGKANDLRKQLRAETFDGQFLRFINSEFEETDIIGKLEMTKRDLQDDSTIKHFVLDDFVSPAQVIDFLPSNRNGCGPFKVTAMLFLREGHIAIGSEGKCIVIWDPKENKKLFELHTQSLGGDLVTALAQLPSGHLASGCNEGCIGIWDLGTQKCKFDFGLTGQPVLWLKALPDGKLIDFSREIRVWDLASNLNERPKSPLFCFEAQNELNWIDRFDRIDDWDMMKKRSMCYLSNMVTLLMDSFGKSIHRCGFDLRVHMEMLWNGNLAYSYALAAGPTVIVWNPNTGKVIKKITFDTENVESCTILPNGDVVLCHSDDKIEIYSLYDQKMIKTFQNDKGPIAAIRMQTRHSIVFVHLRTINLPVFAKDVQLNDANVKHLVKSICFSDDGKRLAVGSTHARLAVLPIKN